MSLTDSLRYQLKGSAVSSRSYIHKVSPTNGSSFTYGGVTRLDIPSGMRNTYLDPSQTWLEFQVTPTFTFSTTPAASCAALDGSAHSLIKKIEVYSSAGSNLLESIDNYGVLYQACANVIGDTDDMASEGSVTEGYKGALAVVSQNSAAPLVAAGATVSTVTAPFINYLSDSLKIRSISGQDLTSGVTYTFQLPLMCLLGTLGDKYIPLHALAADLRVEITWNAGVSAFVSSVPASATISDFPITTSTTTAGTNIGTTYYGVSSDFSTPALPTGYNDGTDVVPVLSGIGTTSGGEFTNVYLHCCMVQVSDDAQAAIDAMTGGVYTWHGTSWRNFQTVTTSKAAASTLNLSFLIPARYSSLKQLLITHRDSDANSTSYIKRGTTSLGHNGLESYQFRVGSVLMPQAKVTAGSGTSAVGWRTEMMMELLRSFHKLGVAGSPSSINIVNWNRGNSDNFHGTFCVGLELESFANKSDVIMSGVSTLGQNIFFEATYGTTTNTQNVKLVDAFASYDVLYTLQDGVLTAQF